MGCYTQLEHTYYDINFQTIHSLLTLGAHAQEGYSSCPVCLCVCVCVSILSILPSCAFRRPTRGISGCSVENAVKLKAVFSKNFLVQKLEAL